MFNFIPRNYFNIQIANNKELQTFKNIGLRSRTRSIGGAGSTSTPEKFGGRFFGNFGDRFFGEIAKQTSAKKETRPLTSSHFCSLIEEDSIISSGLKQVTVGNELSSADKLLQVHLW